MEYCLAYMSLFSVSGTECGLLINEKWMILPHRDLWEISVLSGTSVETPYFTTVLLKSFDTDVIFGPIEWPMYLVAQQILLQDQSQISVSWEAGNVRFLLIFKINDLRNIWNHTIPQLSKPVLLSKIFVYMLRFMHIIQDLCLS